GRLRWAGGAYDVSAYLGVSHVAGDSLAILGLQRSSRRYFQRPDADYVEVESGRTSLTGVTAGINHSKLAGNWRWDVDYTYESPELELNDIGALGSADDQALFADLWYRHTRPGPVLHNWDAGLFYASGWNFGGVRNFTDFGGWFNATFKNFWRSGVELEILPRGLSDAQTRGGPLMRTARWWELDAFLASRSGARTRWEASASYAADELGGHTTELGVELSFRPGTRWEVSLEPGYERTVEPRQYVTTRSGGSAATFGGRYVFARIERSEIVTQVRLNYAVTADLTLEGYLEPFASSGRYGEFGELAAARTFGLRRYGTDGTTITRNGDSTYTVTDGASQFSFGVPDFDVRSLRSNVVVRWEWQTGSTLFLVWQQNRFRRGIPAADVGPDGLWDAFRAPGDHFVALKVSYWIPVR
ncbi:MAG: DUF5916 domain-containing protein, partial [Gemmatimonadales bacterium]